MQLDIHSLRQADLSEADRIFRLAFGTFVGLPEPLAFAGDADYVNTRWRAAPSSSLGAYADGVLVGSNFATRWGSFGFFGPLTVRPDLWGHGIASRLLEATMPLFERWGTRQAALFTFPHSAMHVGLYQKFGFWPQRLTPVMAKTVDAAADAGQWHAYASLSPESRVAALAACRALTDAVFPGLDVGSEIEAVVQQRIGDAVLVYDDAGLVAFALCHCGKGSEAGSDTAYVKFGATRPGPAAARDFERLLNVCEDFALAHGARQLVAGVNTSRHDAYRRMLARGYRTQMQGVAMQQADAAGYNRADCYVIDDWR